MNHTDAKSPSACSLSDQEFRDRRDLVRQELASQISAYRRTDRGLEIDFSGDDRIAKKVGEFADLERQCCASLVFNLSRPGRGMVRLTIEGPSEAAETLALFERFVAAAI